MFTSAGRPWSPKGDRRDSSEGVGRDSYNGGLGSMCWVFRQGVRVLLVRHPPPRSLFLPWDFPKSPVALKGTRLIKHTIISLTLHCVSADHDIADGFWNEGRLLLEEIN